MVPCIQYIVDTFFHPAKPAGSTCEYEGSCLLKFFLNFVLKNLNSVVQHEYTEPQMQFLLSEWNLEEQNRI